MKKKETETAVSTTETPYKRRLGDRKDGRKLRTLPVLVKFTPYIMRQRSDACNTYADAFLVDKTEPFCHEMVKGGNTDFSFLHVLIAAYIRTVAKYPALNRFVSGQTVYARYDIVVNLAVKKEMTVEGEETCIKVKFEPTDTVLDVYRKLNAEVKKAREDKNEGFETVNRVMAHIPRGILRFAMWFLRTTDYYGGMPRVFADISPFHGSMMVTSMGSLGINPIYHHLYDFGNLPVFFAYGKRRSQNEIADDGSVVKHRYVDVKAVTDERICDGFQYAAGFKLFKKYVENPELLLEPPEDVNRDID